MPVLSTPNDIRRWKRQLASGLSYRKIAQIEAQAGNDISYNTIRRAVAQATGARPRSLPTASFDRVALCHDISRTLTTLSYADLGEESQTTITAIAQRLANVHHQMLARDVTEVLRETQHELLRAIGFPLL